MSKIVWFAGSVTGALLLSSCVTYPYDSAFNSCESEANSCYRLCEEIPDEGGYVACQSHCDRDIDRCFDQAYSPYSSGYGYGGYGSGYGYGSPWYGRYGSWYPDTGYFLSFNYYDRYGYRKQRYRPRNDYNYGGGSGGGSRPGYDGSRDPDAIPPRPSDPDRGAREGSRRRYESSGANTPTSDLNRRRSVPSRDAPRRSVDPDAPDSRPSTRRAPTRSQPSYTQPPSTSPPPSSSPRPTYNRPSGATPSSPGPSRRAPSERPSSDTPDRDVD